MGIFTEILERIEKLIAEYTGSRYAGDLLDAEITEPREWIRKFVAGLVYCHGKKQSYYALTYEDNDTDREQELLDAIESETSDHCSSLRDYHGYSQDAVEKEDPEHIYPDIEVGVE